MADPWQPGKVVGPYRIERILGQGGAGQVWLAQDTRLARQVAIKVIHTTAGTVAAERFVREARALAHISHPSIVQIYDVGREDDFRYIVTEFVDGPDLGTLIRKGPIQLSWGVNIAKQIVAAVRAAHEFGVLHRDIKPTNILIDSRNDRAKLTDFGLARGGDELATITGAGAVVGTPIYMAPEQLAAVETGPQSDIYSLGATLYHMFTGQPPRDPSNLIQMVSIAPTHRPPAPNRLRQEIPEELSDAIQRMLEPKAEDRLTSLEELDRILDSLFERLGAPHALTLEERAIVEKHIEGQGPIGTTQMGGHSPPSGFFDNSVFVQKSTFFEDEKARYSKIQETLKFYRDHLSSEYQHLLSQANMTYKLWLGCVGLGFLVLTGGVIAMLAGHIAEGAATSACTILVYFIQRVFQQREDHYRSLAKGKHSHLEYGNQWLLVIQSIDSIEDAPERIKRQSRLVEVLTEKLATRGSELSTAQQTAPADLAGAPVR